MRARPGAARRLTLAAFLILMLGAQAGPPPSAEATAGGLPAWLDAAIAVAPDPLASRSEVPDAAAELAEVRRERRPSWSFAPRARLGYAGDWSAHTDLRLEVPLVEPSVARRERAAERRLRAARRNDRLARRERARALLEGAAQWWRAIHTLRVLDAGLQRAESLPPPTGEAAAELAAWRRLRDEVALDRRLLRRHLAERLGHDPERGAPPDPTGGAAYDALRGPLGTVHPPACIDRDANVVRARGALADARAAARDPAPGARRVHLAVGANVGFDGGLDRGGADDVAPRGPNLTAGARVQVEVGWPADAPVHGSVRASAGHDGVRLEGRVAGPASPEPTRDARDVRDAARARVEEATLEAEAHLRRTHLAWRQVDRHLDRATGASASPSPSSPEDLRAAVAAAPDLPALLDRLDTAVGRLGQRARAARLAAQLAVACEPAVSSGSWSTSRTPRGAAPPPSTRSSSAPASPD